MQQQTDNKSHTQPAAPAARRSHALDALRGYAIMTMVLSAMEAFRVLPRWMYHAQVPPPDHLFNPSIYGITWVDLVFPFFLFSMGAAIPLAYHRQVARGVSRRQLAWKAVLRCLKLTFFAFFCIHMYPYMLGYQEPLLRAVVPILAFILMFILFMRNPFGLLKEWDRVVNGVAYVVAIVWIFLQPYADGKPFSLNDADVIMLILAQVVVTGSWLYLATMHQPAVRAAVIPIIVALFLSDIPGSWQHVFLGLGDPLRGMFNLRYQEYLIIIIIGTFAGDLLRRYETKVSPESDRCTSEQSAGTALLSLLLIVGNVVGLYNRWLVANVVFTLIVGGLLLALLYVPKACTQEAASSSSPERQLWYGMAVLGFYSLLIGLLIEACQGGIRKDDVTLSYLFVTGGLAMLGLLFFSVICDHWRVRWIATPLEMTGRNPMVAYVAGQMLVIPVLTIFQIWPLFDLMAQQPFSGFIRGVILTALTMLIATFCSYRRWYWKT